MKKLTLKKAFYAVLLLGSLGPSTLLAQDSCCSDIVNAINNSRDTVSGKLDRINLDQNTRLDTTTDYLGKIWGFHANDLSMKQAVAALINYEAAEAFRKYQYDQNLLYQVAPGSDWAVSAGVSIGKPVLSSVALGFSNVNLVNHYGLLSGAEKITISGVEVNIQDAAKNAEPLNLYDKLKGFFISGDVSNFYLINPGILIHNYNLTKANISSDQAQQAVSILTDPFPAVNEDLRSKLKFGGIGLTGAEKENLVEQVAYGSAMGLTTSAFGDIIARRTPAAGTDQSVMEVMANYSKQRFTDPEWYKSLGAASDSAILREIAHMQAYSIWVDYQHFRVSEQQMALLASLNAIMSKMNITMGQLVKELELARSQAQAYQAEANRDAEKADKSDDSDSSSE